MIDFFSLREEAFGMEITDETVRVMKLARRRGSVATVAVGSAQLEAGVVRNGEIKDEIKLSKTIKDAVGAAGKNLKSRRVIVSLPENKAFLQVIPMPRLREEELRAAVTFEAENYIPLPLEKVYLDFEEIAALSGAKRGEVLMAAMPREIVDSRIRAVELAGLTPVVMELESQAAARALNQNNFGSGVAVIVQIGDSKTNLIICSRNSIRFTFSIPISNSYFLETIAASANLSLEGAQALKVECGIEEFVHSPQTSGGAIKDGDAGSEKRKIFEALIPGLVDFVQQMKKCIQYFQTHENQNCGSEKENNIEKILICGSGSNLKGLDEFIALKLNTQVVRALPDFGLIEEKLDNKANFPCDNACSFVVVAGLALRALEQKIPKNKKNDKIEDVSLRSDKNNSVRKDQPDKKTKIRVRIK